MMDQDIDAMLARLRCDASGTSLDGMEDRVLAAIGERQRNVAGTRLTMLAAASALVLGVASTSMPAGEARAMSSVSFGQPGPLAPSSLLLGPAH